MPSFALQISWEKEKRLTVQQKILQSARPVHRPSRFSNTPDAPPALSPNSRSSSHRYSTRSSGLGYELLSTLWRNSIA